MMRRVSASLYAVPRCVAARYGNVLKRKAQWKSYWLIPLRHCIELPLKSQMFIVQNYKMITSITSYM